MNKKSNLSRQGLTLIASATAGLLYSQSPVKPNIVYILTDDLGYTDLACYGHPFNETPHIDQLAKEGIRFTDAYAACPVSSPSRAALLTGKYPARLGLTNFLVGEKMDEASPILPPPDWKKQLDSKEVTIAEVMKQQGYVTGLVGKWHVGSHDTCAPWNQGFDYTRMIGKNGLDYYNYSIYEDSYNREFKDNGEEYLTDKLTEYSLEFIDMNKDKPFYLHLTYSAPHVLIVPRGDKLKKYLFKYPTHKGKYNPYYAAVVESIDDGVGMVVEALKKAGIYENTIIVFTSDNGGVGLNELGPVPTTLEPLRKWKGHIYEGGIRVPAIITWKNKISAGQESDTYFSHVDYFPTFCDILGVKKLPAHVDGKSIYPILLNTADKKFDRGPIFWHYPHFSNQQGRPAGAVRVGEYKLVENYETNALELYNLKEDISEANDLSEKMPDKTKQMHEMLVQWRKSVNAQMPIANPGYKK